MNTIALSGDRKEMVVSDGNGRRAKLRSARPNGFTDYDVEVAKTWPMKHDMVPGQTDRAQKFTVRDKPFFIHINTGPPTWWRPRFEVSKSSVMIGWLRLLVALSWKDKP